VKTGSDGADRPAAVRARRETDAVASLRAAQKQMTRQLLLDRGLELFGEKGYAATTVDDIAAAAGTTRATFYLHFPSKAELMRSLVETTNDVLTRPDVPPLLEVVRSGDREQIRA
jgi:AcrR family transcriptional regulator